METAEDHPPLILCMENLKGEEVVLRVEPNDDFNTFLIKAKSVLGFDVDLNSVTRNQTVALTDNAYQFLINNESALTSDMDQELSAQTLQQILEPSTNGPDDLVYILDDGTQINASQIQFYNEDPLIDLTREKLPFVKYNDDIDEEEDENLPQEETKVINIVESPISRWSSKNNSPKSSFITNLPFRLVSTNSTSFEAQFNKFLENRAPKTYTTLNTVTNVKKSPRSLIKDNYSTYCEDGLQHKAPDSSFSREDVLNMFKDSPVASNDVASTSDKRRNARKTDPSKLGFKRQEKKGLPFINIDGALIGQDLKKNCFICDKNVDSAEKLYFFDNEDQKIHRSSPKKHQRTRLKIICDKCLEEYFKPCEVKGSDQPLNPNEFLVIKNNQQYIFQKVKDYEVKGTFAKEEIPSKETKIDDKPPVIVIKDENDEMSSDVEVIESVTEIDDTIIENLEEADEEVKEFLGKYQKTEHGELKCRFCNREFAEISEVMDHGTEHKHDMEDGDVYPCPLCDYGYASLKFLRAHLKTAHDRPLKKEPKQAEESIPVTVTKDPNDDSATPLAAGTEDKESEETMNPPSPIAGRTRSSARKNNSDVMEKGKGEAVDANKDIKQELATLNEETMGENRTETDTHIITTLVKQESQWSDEEEGIWIVEAAEDSPTPDDPDAHRCYCCNEVFQSIKALSLHKCTKTKGVKRKASLSNDLENGIFKKPHEHNSSGNSLLIERAKKRKAKGPSSDPQILTCHHCNESFSSKVRLKFHMQFHDKPELLTAAGLYKCRECGDAVTFSSESELFDHEHFRHNKQRKWQCPVPECRKTFRMRATLTKHSRVHTDTRRYVCVTCGRRFLDKQTLDEHSVTHLQIKPFQCHICLKQLTRRSRLRMHLRAHEESPGARRLPACAVCARAFRDTRHADEHGRTSSACLYEIANDLKQEKEDAVLSPSSGMITKNTSPPKPRLSARRIKREVSGREAETVLSAISDEARAMIRLVQIEKAFRCEYCEDVFYIEEGLNKHREIHKGVKNPFTCHICKVSFATYSRCTTHKTTHGWYKRAPGSHLTGTEVQQGPLSTGILGYGDFPVVKHFLCEDCGRSYLHWTYLQVHRRMKHANQNYLYKCNYCELTFPNSWSVAYHRKKVHGKTGHEDNKGTTKIAKEDVDHKIPCRDCDMCLPNKSALYKHRQKEHSFCTLYDDYGNEEDADDPAIVCVKCGRGFSNALLLNEHLKLSKACSNSTRVRHNNAPKTTPNIINNKDNRNKCDYCTPDLARMDIKNPYKCPKCRKRRDSSDGRTVLVLEMDGADPTTDEIMAHLKKNNVDMKRVLDISKISFPKGVTSVIPNSERALSMISNLQKATDVVLTSNDDTKTLEPQNGPVEGQIYNIALEGEEVSDLNVSLLLRERVSNEDIVSTDNQQVNMSFDHTLLL